MTKETSESFPLPLAFGIFAIVIVIALFFSGANAPEPTTNTPNPSTISAVYTSTTAKVRECASQIDCKVVGTYPINTSIDVSTYGVTDVSQLPDWVSFTYPSTDGSNATGYISKTVLSNTQTSAGSASEPAYSGGTVTQEQSVVTNQTQQAPASPRATSLTAIIKEWRPSAAYVECYWNYAAGGAWYYKQSGSGLLAILSSQPTVITNKHVVYSSQYGVATECDFAFPDDKYVFYSVRTADVPAHDGLPDNPVIGQIQYTADGNDIAYLSGFKEYNNGYNYTPPLSVQQRAKDGSFACKSTPSIGDPLVILGYPVYGSGVTSVFSKIEITATEGIVSGNDSGYYTTSAKIDHGNSGGLAIDTTNDCYMGIPTASYTGSIESLGRILPVSYVVKY